MADTLFLTSAIFLSYNLLISLVNLLSAPRLSKGEGTFSTLKLSILVPARNEEDNIGQCVRSLLDQDYPDFEIIVLNDFSEDNTLNILNKLRQEHPRLRVVNNEKEPPSGWLGKNWACHQLSEQAQGELLLFIDADVELKQGVLRAAVEELQRSKSGLVSLFPRQLTKSFGELLVVPNLYWILLSFNPILSVYKLPFASTAAVIGQFLLFTRKAYEASGGHQAVRKQAIEDISLAQRSKRAGFKVKALLATDWLSCRMYSNYQEAMQGFSKAMVELMLHSGFGMPLLVGIIFIAHSLPFLLVWLDPRYLPTILAIFIQALPVAILTARPLGQSLFLAPLQRLQILLDFFYAVYLYLSGTLTWKKRKVF